MNKMTELQKKLYDKIILAANYIRCKKEKQIVVKLDKDKIYERWKPIIEKMGIMDPEKQTLLCKYAQIHKETEGKSFMPFSGESSEHAKETHDLQFTLIPMSMKVYAQLVTNEDFLGGYVGKNNKEPEDTKQENKAED